MSLSSILLLAQRICVRKPAKEVVVVSIIIMVGLGYVIPINYFGSVTAKLEDRTVVHKKYVPGKFETYKDSTLGFKIEYPSDWQRVDTPKSLDTLVSFYSPPLGTSDTFRDNIVITAGKYSQNISSSKFIEDFVAQLQTAKGIKVDEVDKNYKISGHDAYKVVYSVNQGRDEYHVMRVGVPVGSNFYVITYTSQLSSFAEFIDTVNKMLSSVEISSSPEIANGKYSFVYHDNKTGVTLQYPTNWTFARPGYLLSNLTLYAPLDNLTDTYFENLRIYLTKMAPGSKVTLQNLYRAQVSDLKSKLQNFSLGESKYVKISNLPAVDFTYNYSANNKIFKIRNDPYC